MLVGACALALPVVGRGEDTTEGVEGAYQVVRVVAMEQEAASVR
jgi:hypothetical protein